MFSQINHLSVDVELPIVKHSVHIHYKVSADSTPELTRQSEVTSLAPVLVGSNISPPYLNIPDLVFLDGLYQERTQGCGRHDLLTRLEGNSRW